jgi:signal transduction histidine kinase
MTLRARLAWMYGIAVAIMLAVVGIVSVIAIDSAMRNSLDARLRTALGAATAFVDVHNGQPVLDPEDQVQLRTVLGTAMDAAVFNTNEVVLALSTDAVPKEVLAAVRVVPETTLLTVGRGVDAVRLGMNPVTRNGRIYGVVAVWIPSGYIDQIERFSLSALAVATFLIGGVVVLLSSVIARRALAPLARFTALAANIEAHDLSQRAGTEATGELGVLAQAFDRMLGRLEGAFARQRQFTADASHELRAPLAVIRAEAEVALSRERSSEEYQRALRTIGLEIERIDALVEALLLAARADSAQVTLEPVDLGAISMLAVSRFTHAAQARNIEIVTALDDAIVSGDANSLERAVAALVHNALDFAASTVRVSLGRHGNEVILTIEDDGPGFSPEGLQHATERFWRGEPVRRRGSTGLGLSIVDAVMRVHGGMLTLANASPNGARVSMTIRSSGRHSAVTLSP